MKRFIRNIALVAALGLSMSQIQAQCPKSPQPIADPCNPNPCVPDPCCHVDSRHVPCVVTPDASPVVGHTIDPFFTADFIYWTVRQDGMFYAVSGAGTNPSKGSVHDLDWGMDPGFKVGVGINLAHDGWDIYALYTWIKSDASDSTSQNAATSTLTPYWVINGNIAQIATLSNARASWDLHFNDINLELGRNCYLSPSMKLRLHVGLEASWIDQDYSVRYVSAVDGSIHRMNIDQDFWGVGLRAGFNTAWQFTKNWGLFGDLALATLWGQFELERRDRRTVNNATTTTLRTGVKPHTLEPVVDVAAGLRFDYWFCNDDYHLGILAGWEHQLWILQNEYIKRLQEPDHIGDLVLQGLTVQFRFDF